MEGNTVGAVTEEVQHDVRVDRVRLEKMMESRGFTNTTLAEALGKHYNSVLRLKEAQSLPFSELTNLCVVLNCHPFDLIVAEGFPEPFSLAPASH